MKLIEHFVNGKIIPGSSDKKGKVFNPATGEQESEVRLASKSDLDSAVEVAKKAFETWSLKPALQRARIIFKFKELIEKNSDELTKLIVSEHGKVYEDARGSLTRGLEVVEFACGIPHLLKGEFSENVGTNVDSWSMRQPLGVVAGITPFNFPAMVPMWMFPIAIACGNTFILKPSEKDPSCGLRLAELLSEAGLPDGVFNVINGDKEAVDASTASLSPFITLNTPSGRPASDRSSANLRPQDGSFSDGLRIKVFPHAIAIGNIHIGTIAGKLKGVIPATTPKGCLIDQLSTLVPTFSENSPFNKCGIPQANSTTSSPLVKEPLASS